MTSDLRAWAVEGIGEVTAGTDLSDLLTGVALQEGDVVLVTSKVVSKAEGRSRHESRDDAVAQESVRVVARRGATRIVENRLGLVMAAAGVDASNVSPGHVVRLPVDPDASARGLRERLQAAHGLRLAVVVTDTAGRAWRQGQTDLAVGVAGLMPLQDLTGRVDAYGNPLLVTAPAVADELASVAELVTGKLGGRPVSVVRGLGERVLPVDDHGPGARALLRPRAQDMFALGAREAVVAALTASDADCFGSPADADELTAALRRAGLDATPPDADGNLRVRLPEDVGARARSTVHLELLTHAHGWQVRIDPEAPHAVVLRAGLRSGDPDPSA